MATANALDGEPKALKGAVFADGFHGILAASGRKAASRRREGRNASLIEANGQYEHHSEHFQHQPPQAKQNICSVIHRWPPFEFFRAQRAFSPQSRHNRQEISTDR